MNSFFDALRQIEENIYHQQQAMVSRFRRLAYDLPEAYRPDFDDSGWEASAPGFPFEKEGDTLWARFQVIVPETVMGQPVCGSPLRLMSNFQAPLQVYCDGELILDEQYWSDFRTPEIRLTESARPGQTFQLAFRLSPAQASFQKNRFLLEAFLETAEWAAFDLSLFRHEMVYLQMLDGHEPLLEQIGGLVAAPAEQVLAGTLPVGALTALIEEARRLGEPMRAAAKTRKIFMVGHAHIDMNWLWDTAETHRLIDRDFTTVCNLLDEYPEFRFSQSQCAVYEICERQNPALFERVRQNIRQGRWEVTASAWVENDSNMATGEEIARHILYSKAYLKEKFDVNPDIMWAPDTFGHSTNLPQILQKGGVTRYFFMRCGQETVPDHVRPHGYGNAVSDLPVFNWQGLDGSAVTAANLEYNGEFHPAVILRNVDQAKEMGLSVSLCVYGIGDHGGAPTRRDIERALKAARSPLFPEIQLATAGDYFDALEADLRTGNVTLPTREGEMNFVFEGCYTSHGDLKTAVRRLGSALFEVETLCTAAAGQGNTYPYPALLDTWRTLLFHQFHDIFDGCALAKTYEEAAEQLGMAQQTANGLIAAALEKLTAPDENQVTFFNATPYNREETVLLPGRLSVRDRAGEQLPVQLSRAGTYVRAAVPAFSGVSLRVDAPASAAALPVRETAEAYLLQNDYYEIELDKATGEMVTYYDRTTGRYLCRKSAHSWRTKRGGLNTFAVYHESPGPMSAWEIAPTTRVDYLTRPTEVFVKETGALLTVISLRYRYGASEIEQDILFDQNSPVIRFDTRVDWRERGHHETGARCLRVGFSPDVCGEVVNEIPFGALSRPCKQAEYPQLRFSALTDDRGGFALLNDCKYGVKTGGNLLELSLLRSGYEPDPRADIGHHRFSYAVLPFAGRLAESDVLRYASQINTDLRVLPQTALRGKTAALLPFVLDFPANVLVSAVKRAESGKGYVLRVCECFGGSAAFSVRSTGPLTVHEVDLNETEELDACPFASQGSGQEVSLMLDAYEIKTVVINFN